MSEMQVIEMRAENFARLKLVELELHGESLVVSGRNMQGKSSVLRAVEATICGKGASPSMPVHEGAESASVRITLGTPPDDVQLTIEKKWKDGRERLVVKNADGVSQGSAQRVLDAVRGALGFDVMAFATPAGAKTDVAADKARVAMLAEIAPLPIDLAEHAARRKDVFDERTSVNRALRDAEAQIAGARIEDVPERVDVRDAMDAVRTAEDMTTRRKRAAAIVEEAPTLIARYRAEIAAIEGHIATAESAAVREARLLETHPAPDLDELRRTVAEASDRNEEAARIEARNAAVARSRERIADLTRSADGLSARLARMDTEKREALASVALPAGLSLTDDGVGVLLNDRPFSAASTSERIRASVRVMAARNPRLRTCLVRDGNDLDAEMMREVLDFAREEKFQLIVERISADVPGAVVIEDGEVRA